VIFLKPLVLMVQAAFLDALYTGNSRKGISWINETA
jgi:hypothetical protein